MANDSDNSPPSKRPYMLRALWQWCMDSGLTPQILVNAAFDGVDVPAEYVKDDAIVLNVHERAVRGLDMNNESVSFSARFAGRPRSLFVPMEAIVAIYARENGQGLFFEAPNLQDEAGVIPDATSTGQDDAPAADPAADPAGDADDDAARPRGRGRPDLKIV